MYSWSELEFVFESELEAEIQKSHQIQPTCEAPSMSVIYDQALFESRRSTRTSLPTSQWKKLQIHRTNHWDLCCTFRYASFRSHLSIAIQLFSHRYHSCMTIPTIPFKTSHSSWCSLKTNFKWSPLIYKQRKVVHSVVLWSMFWILSHPKSTARWWRPGPCISWTKTWDLYMQQLLASFLILRSTYIHKLALVFPQDCWRSCTGQNL